MFSDIGNVTVPVVAVGATVPLVLSAIAARPRVQVAVDSVLVPVIDGILHACVAVGTNNIRGTLLTNAWRVGTVQFVAEVHVVEWFARVCQGYHLVAVLTVNDLRPPAVSTQTFLNVSRCKTDMTFGTLSVFFRCTVLTGGRLEGILAPAFHAEFHQPRRDLHIPFERVSQEPIANITAVHGVQGSKGFFKVNDFFLQMQLERHAAINLHGGGYHMKITCSFSTGA